MGDNDPRGLAIFDPRGMVGRIYKEDHYTLLHTKFESSGPCSFGEEDFFMIFPLRPRGGACMDPRGTVGRIYKEVHYTLLHTKYKSSGPCGFGEEDFFLCFFPLKVYGNYLLPWKPEFQSDLAQNLMQHFPYPNDASDNI